MNRFMDENFMLHSQTAKTLYHEYAAKMPIIDYHCHISPVEIAENRKFDNITQAWLGADTYKWRLMRTMGVDERFVTGDASDREKFQKFVETLPKCVGNPVYHWSHLELKRYFGCELELCKENAQNIWDLTGQMFKQDSLRVRGLIERSHVQVISTTDDPIDDLASHKVLAHDSTFGVTVTPTMRPDKAVNIHQPGFSAYITKLAQVSGKVISSLDDLKCALLQRIDFFRSMGCRASDHGHGYIVYRTAKPRAAEDVFQKGLSDQTVTEEEKEIFQTDLMLFFGREFAKRDWVMQLHYGALWRVNDRMTARFGSDYGFDSIGTRDASQGLAQFFNALDKEDHLPKTVLYSLNPSDNAMVESLTGCFQGSGIAGKMQHGTAWWFNDTKLGMENQILTLAEINVLGAFIGMLTDSSSFLSYTRHEYFRRILCNLLGKMVEQGEYPNNMNTLGTMVEDICYRNTARYFGYEVRA